MSCQSLKLQTDRDKYTVSVVDRQNNPVLLDGEPITNFQQFQDALPSLSGGMVGGTTTMDDLGASTTSCLSCDDPLILQVCMEHEQAHKMDNDAFIRETKNMSGGAFQDAEFDHWSDFPALIQLEIDHYDTSIATMEAFLAAGNKCI